MSDLELVFEPMRDGSGQPLTRHDALLGHSDVATAGHYPGPDHPDVQIVDVEHPSDRSNRLNDGPHIGSGRRSFEEHRRAVLLN